MSGTDEVVEHAIGMAGGSMAIRDDGPSLEAIYPLAEWIKHRSLHGGKVYRREIIVVKDWVDVSDPPDVVPPVAGAH